MVRRSGLMVKMELYEAFNSHDKYFEAEAPANNPDKVGELIDSAIEKGMSEPKRRKNWWAIE